jgi:hypothetical protein
MNWWIIGGAAALPWLRFVLQPSMSIKAAGFWGIWVLGVGMCALIVVGPGLFVARRSGMQVTPDQVDTAALTALAFTLSGLLILGVAGWQADAVDRRRGP